MSINTNKASIVAASLGALAAIMTAVITVTFEKGASIQIGGLEFGPAQTIVSTNQIATFESEIGVIKNQLATLSSLPKEAAVSLKLSELESKVTKLTEDMGTINKVIMQSPQKALEIPMLRRDMLSLQAQYENSTKSLEREIVRAYDTMKWVIGTIVLGILGLAASILLKGKGD